MKLTFIRRPELECGPMTAERRAYIREKLASVVGASAVDEIDLLNALDDLTASQGRELPPGAAWFWSWAANRWLPADEYTFVRTNELREFLDALGELLEVRPHERSMPVLDVVRERIARRALARGAEEGAAGSG